MASIAPSIATAVGMPGARGGRLLSSAAVGAGAMVGAGLAGWATTGVMAGAASNRAAEASRSFFMRRSLLRLRLILAASSGEEPALSRARGRQNRLCARKNLTQKRVKLTGPFQGVKLVAAANMGIADEYLRHGAGAAAFGQHFIPRALVHEDIHFLEGRAFLGQQRFGAHAIRTDRRGVDTNRLHGEMRLRMLVLYRHV